MGLTSDPRRRLSHPPLICYTVSNIDNSATPTRPSTSMTNTGTGDQTTMTAIQYLRSLTICCIVAVASLSCTGTDADVADRTDQEVPAVQATPPPSTPEISPTPTSPVLAEETETAEPDPWEVTVLTVKDDGTQIVPAFDDIELEYPLYAQTAFGNSLVLLVEEFDETGEWAKVAIPIRPNGTTAWVETAFFDQSTHNYRITIDLSDNLVSVYRGEELLIEHLAATGRPSTPTPVGRGFIDEIIAGSELDVAYGTWIMSISVFSESLGTFGGGGMPKIALHGTDEPELVGQPISAGGIRVPNEIISQIADVVPVGTVVDIVP